MPWQKSGRDRIRRFDKPGVPMARSKGRGGVQLSLPPSTRLCDSLTGGKIKQSIFEINLAERAVLAFAFPVEGKGTEMIEAHCEAP